MLTKVQKWGNNLALRIPRVYAKDARINKDSVVDVSIVDGQIIIKPVPPSAWTIGDLIAGISDSNLHLKPELDKLCSDEDW
jgi:antitoxin MazE